MSIGWKWVERESVQDRGYDRVRPRCLNGRSIWGKSRHGITRSFQRAVDPHSRDFHLCPRLQVGEGISLVPKREGALIDARPDKGRKRQLVL